MRIQTDKNRVIRFIVLFLLVLSLFFPMMKGTFISTYTGNANEEVTLAMRFYFSYSPILKYIYPDNPPQYGSIVPANPGLNMAFMLTIFLILFVEVSCIIVAKYKRVFSLLQASEVILYAATLGFALSTARLMYNFPRLRPDFGWFLIIIPSLTFIVLYCIDNVRKPLRQQEILRNLGESRGHP
jgi:hypothetical protein